MSSNEVRDALRTLEERLPGWIEAEQRRGALANEIASLERYLRELDILQQVQNPEPWQQARLRLLASGVGTDEKRLAELQDEKQRHEEVTVQLKEAERILFRFADRHGIDPEPLRRLLASRDLDAEEVIPVLRRVVDVLARDGEATEMREAKGGRGPAKRPGRPRKNETDKEQLVIGALVAYHKWQLGGSVENYTPAKTKRLAELASCKQVSVSVATVSRFLKRKFPGCGYKGYEAACLRERIGALLTLWQGEVPEHLVPLQPHESGREDDD